LQLLDGSSVEVAGETNLEWDAFVEDILRQRSHAENLTILDLHVFDETRPMADPVRAAPLDRLPDGFLPEAFTGMNRDVEILPLNVMKRVDVLLRRISAFF